MESDLENIIRQITEAPDAESALAASRQAKTPLDSKSEYLIARAWENRGNALYRIGTPEALRDAVYGYDEAIKLRQDLPLHIPEYRDGLARAWENRGNVLYRIGTPEALRDAFQSYTIAVKISEPFGLERGNWIFTFIHARWLCAQFIVDFPDLVDAVRRVDIDPTDLVESALALLCINRNTGFHLYDKYFARLLRSGLQLYLAQTKPAFAAEFAIDFLDPEKRLGAGCDLLDVYEEALPLLFIAKSKLTKQSINAPDVSEDMAVIEGAVQRLSKLRQRYFGGTAEAARLEADYWHSAGDTNRGLEGLLAFNKSQPFNTKGLLATCEYMRATAVDPAGPGLRARVEPLLTRCLQSALLQLSAIPSKAETERLHEFAVSVLARLALLRLPALPSGSVLKSPNGWLVRDNTDKALKDLGRHLAHLGRDLEEQAQSRGLPRDWIEPLVDEVIGPRLAEWESLKQKQTYSEAFEDGVGAGAAITSAAIETLLRISAEAGARVDRLSDSMDIIRRKLEFQLEACWATYAKKAGIADERELAGIIDDYASILLKHVHPMMERLAESDRNRGAELARSAIGAALDRLSENEQKTLGTMLFLFAQPDGTRLSGILSGVLLEDLLSRCCFQNVREACITTGLVLEIPNGRDTAGEKLRKYLNTREGGHLALGDLIGILEHAVYRPKNNGHPAFAEYARLLSSFKVIAKLELLTTPPANSRHPEILNHILQIRNDCVHARKIPPTRERVATAIEQLTSPDTGFLAGFLRAVAG